MDFDDLLLHPLTLFREHPDRLAGLARALQLHPGGRVPGHQPGAVRADRSCWARTATSAPWATTTSRSTAGAAPTCATCRTSSRTSPGARLVRLEENYRSTQVVLDAANAVIAENSGRMGKTLRDPAAGRGAGDAARRGRRARRGRVGGPRAGAPARGGRLELRRDGGALPHQLAVARAGRGVPPRRDPLSADRRDQLLRAARGEGPAGLPAAGRQSGRRRGVPPRGRACRAAASATTSLATLRGRPPASGSKPLLATAPRGRPDPGSPAQRARGASARSPRSSTAWRSRRSDLPPAEVLEQVIAAIDYEAVLLAEGPEGADRWENVRELVASAANWSEEVTEDAEAARRSSDSWPRRRCSRRPTRSSGATTA